MPSVHKKPSSRSPFWFAAYRGPDGRRVQKSTKTKNRAEALRIAVELETLANKGREGSLVDSQVRKIVADINEQSTGTPLYFKSVEEYFGSWVLNKQGSTKEATFGRYKQIAESFLKFMGRRQNGPLTGVTPSDIQGWRDAFRKGDRAVSTVNLGLTILSGAFERARELGYVQVNPCAAVDPLAKEESDGREPFTWEQVEKIANAAAGSAWEGGKFGLVEERRENNDEAAEVGHARRAIRLQKQQQLGQHHGTSHVPAGFIGAKPERLQLRWD